MGSEDEFGERVDDAKVPQASYAPRVNGLYVGTEPEVNDSGTAFYTYLRFTVRERVTSVSSSGTVAQVARWLGPRHAGSGQGTYELDGAAISFNATCDSGTVLYSGTVGDGGLSLHLDSHSLINDHRAHRTYRFVATEFWSWTDDPKAPEPTEYVDPVN